METPLFSIDGYIIECGALGIGMKNGKRGSGIVFEIPDGEMELRHISKGDVKIAAKYLGRRVTLTVALIGALAAGKGKDTWTC